jgi:hypothetical protein
MVKKSSINYIEGYKQCKSCNIYFETTAKNFWACFKCTKKIAARGLVTTNCAYCGKEFTTKKSTTKCCSPSCRNYYTCNKEKIKYFRRNSVENSLKAVFWGCKSRAKRLNRECNLTQEYLLEMLKKQKGKCAATGILMKPSAQATTKNKDPFTISIDRIDSSKGYIEGNVQLVCTMYNMAKNCFTQEDITFMFKSYLEYNKII